MKKSFVLLLVLVILVSGTVCYAQNELLQEKDQVHFEEKVIYGDKSAAEGAIVEMYNEYESQLFWHSTYEVGAQQKETTEYTFYPWKHYEYGRTITGGLDFMSDYFTLSTGLNFDDEKTYSGLEAAMKELYDQTLPGEEKAIAIYLKDYMDYYTFGLSLSLPQEDESTYKSYYDGIPHLWESALRDDVERLEATGQQPEDLAEAKKCLEDVLNFKQFFRIPVIDTEIYGLAIAKDENGEVIAMAEQGVSGGSSTGNIDFPRLPEVEGSDAFTLGMRSAFCDGNCYLTFDTHTFNGAVVDTSLIPGGYGIYHFSYDSKKGEIDSDGLKMIYALNPEIIVNGLCVDARGEHLLLTTEENGRHYMSIIELDTMILKDKLDIGQSDVYYDFWTFEDYLIISSDTLAMYTIDEVGNYTHEFSADMTKMDEIIGYPNESQSVPTYSSTFDWDGECLLIGNYIHVQEGLRCAFSLAVVDKTGLLYYGVYESTLMTSDVSYQSCTPETSMEKPVIVKWKK